MRAGLLALGAALLALAYALRSDGPGAAARPAERPPAVAEASPPPVPVEGSPMRNVFEYVERPVAPEVTAPPVPRAPAALESAPPKAEPPVRLVGLMNRGGRLHAALAVRGEVVVVSTGESAAGYVVEAIDDDDGVRLRGPDGATFTLPPPN
jgi:hypothetical protein